MKPTESIPETVVREVQEEMGIEADVRKVLGVSSKPRHVSKYDDGEVRQQFSVCFLCRAAHKPSFTTMGLVSRDYGWRMPD
jgi:8-oxo-dGTP pyrophosphatase MutT (NUDIX family)